jgi:hypothetical protein
MHKRCSLKSLSAHVSSDHIRGFQQNCLLTCLSFKLFTYAVVNFLRPFQNLNSLD